MAISARELERLMILAHKLVLDKILFLLKTTAIKKDQDLRVKLRAMFDASKNPTPYLRSINMLANFMTRERNIESFFKSRHGLRRIPPLEIMDKKFNAIINKIKRAFSN